MDTIAKIPILIIKEQELVIGPLAWYEAGKVSGLTVDQIHNSASFSGDAKEIIDQLVARYERIFGKASHEVCKDAVREIVATLPPEQVPASLK